MTDTIVKEVTASEVVGEFRRMQRASEYLAYAGHVLEVLVTAEKREAELNKNIATLETEAQELEGTVSAAHKAMQEATERTLLINHSNQDSVEAAKRTAEEITKKAKLDAEQMITAAKQEIAAMHTATELAEKHMREARNEAQKEEDSLNAFRQKAAAEKARIKSSFGI